jgi:hypothetical protein
VEDSCECGSEASGSTICSEVFTPYTLYLAHGPWAYLVLQVHHTIVHAEYI